MKNRSLVGLLFLAFGLACGGMSLKSVLRLKPTEGIKKIEGISVFRKLDSEATSVKGATVAVIDSSAGRIGIVYNSLGSSGYVMMNNVAFVSSDEVLGVKEYFRYFPSLGALAFHLVISFILLLGFGFLFAVLG